MFHTSYIEIRKSAYKQNLKFIRSQVGGKVIISSVIKGNAYGHGIENIVLIAESAGIRHFSAFSTDEAKRVKHASTKKSEIMIMGMIDDASLPWVLANEISFYVFEFERLKVAIDMAKRLNKKALIHVEVETGFHRTGYEWEEKEKLAKILKENEPYISLAGLCTHYAGAESISNYVRVKRQIERFNEFKQWFIDHGINFPNLPYRLFSGHIKLP
jgi:alanine racemase